MAVQVNILLWILPFSCLFFVADTEDSCTQKLWCNDCITAREGCAWCEDKDFSGSRCKSEADMLPTVCKTIHSPNNSAEFLQNDGFRDGSDNYDAIQLTPQHVSVTLRPGKKYVLDMRYRVSQNLPIDMYFVLDFSVTMKSRIQDLADLTANLIQQLQQKFTKNIHIGFGSFLDKPIQPFHITTPEHLANPCVLQGTVCEPSYGYIHRSRLNNDINKFINTIRKAQTSANFDPMEGGLDAVMQASVCPEIIGWRNKTRRVMVYISDSGFHFAGDAKLAGIDAPNDGICHMRHFNNSLEEFIYSHSTLLDYPSFGHLKKALSENNINAFFVVKQDDQMIYKGLTDMIGTQAATEIMDVSGTSNIVSRIIEYYKDLSSKVSIKAENLPDEMDIIAESNCSGRVVSTFKLKDQEIRCTGLEIGKEVFFKVTLTADRCPKDKKTVHTVQLIPSGLQESLQLDIQYICDCMCTNSTQLDKDQCFDGNGTYECGVCRCNEGRSGEKCQCDNSESATDLSSDEASCKKSNETNSVCEDHGKCQCGQCVCNKGYGGKYCECENTKCIFPGSSLECSGADKGGCVCEMCVCKAGYQGDYCQCPTDDVCVADGDNKACSGHGQCDCGKCACNQGYEGKFCDKCQGCNICSKCGNDTQKECIKCLDRYNFKNVSQTQCNEVCSGIDLTRVDSFLEEQELCAIYDKADCQLNYYLQCESTEVPKIRYSAVPVCVKPPDPLLIAMPVVAGIIGVGILLLIIWKILTSFYDKIEYARFEHEIKNPKWSKTDNPIYKTPLTSNMNPAYRGMVDE